jgi:hypothetical protein
MRKPPRVLLGVSLERHDFSSADDYVFCNPFGRPSPQRNADQIGGDGVV